MNWYLTWQDGAALLLALMGLLFAWWLHRKAASPHGCGRCPMLQEPLAKASLKADDNRAAPDQKMSSPPTKTSEKCVHVCNLVHKKYFFFSIFQFKPVIEIANRKKNFTFYLFTRL